MAWLKAAGWELVLQKPAPVPGSVRVNISAGRPDRRRRDVDNLSKAVLDLLTKHQVIEDDSRVVSLSSSWDESIATGRVHVTIKRALATKRREVSTPAAKRLDL